MTAAPPSLSRESSLHDNPLPEEDPNDPFDRQRCILDWKQEQLSKQVAFVLGCGGLGCSVALSLCRLGVGKVVLLDNDVVETSNLNRQLLFSLESVGQRKVDAAAAGLAVHNVGGTVVETMHVDALEDWQAVVSTARASTVIFNNIDIGGMFDYAVLSLSKKLGIPYAAGSSYATTWIVEYFSGRPGKTSFSAQFPEADADVIAKLHPSCVDSHENLKFIPFDDNPPTRSIGSNVLVCGSAGIMTVNMWAQSLMGNEMPNFTKFDVSKFWGKDDTIAWMEPDEAE